MSKRVKGIIYKYEAKKDCSQSIRIELRGCAGDAHYLRLYNLHCIYLSLESRGMSTEGVLSDSKYHQLRNLVLDALRDETVVEVEHDNIGQILSIVWWVVVFFLFSRVLKR